MMTPEEKKQKEAERAQNAAALEVLLRTNGWAVIENHILDRVAEAKNVMAISDVDANVMIREVIRRRARVDTYMGLLNWIKNEAGLLKPKGADNG